MFRRLVWAHNFKWLTEEILDTINYRIQQRHKTRSYNKRRLESGNTEVS